MILQSLAIAHGNKSKAAELLHLEANDLSSRR